MLKIGEFSKLSRISIRMLRHYDEVGILVPQNIDDFTGYRYYNEQQLDISSRIVALRDMGFNISTIKQILNNYENTDALCEFLNVKRIELQTDLNEKQQRLLFLETTINRLRKDEKAMNYNVNLKTLPERYVASVRKTIECYEQEGILWGMLMEETKDLKLKDSDPSYTLAIFHDGEHKESNVDVEVQKSVVGNYPNTENVIFKTEPATLIASAIFKGGYEQFYQVNEAVANWVQDNGYTFTGLAFNIYHISPHETQNPDEFVTEVCYPVKSK